MCYRRFSVDLTFVHMPIIDVAARQAYNLIACSTPAAIGHANNNF
jgi:hypothetical protein